MTVRSNVIERDMEAIISPIGIYSIYVKHGGSHDKHPEQSLGQGFYSNYSKSLIGTKRWQRIHLLNVDVSCKCLLLSLPEASCIYLLC